MARRKRNRITAAAETNKSKFMAPTLGIEGVYFTHMNRKAVAEFGIIRSKLSRRICSKDKGAIG